MTQPTVGPAAQELYDRLAPIYGLDDEQHDWSLLHLCAAFTAGLELLEAVGPTDKHLPWAILLDVDDCPDWALPWLAWVLGLTVRAETPEQLRALCRDRPPAKRGTPDAMRAAVASVLSGTRPTLSGTRPTVRYLERADGPFEDTIVTRRSETPPTDLLTVPLVNLFPNPNARDAPYTQGWTELNPSTSLAGINMATLGPALDSDFDGHGLLSTYSPHATTGCQFASSDPIPVEGNGWYVLRCRVKILSLASPTWPVSLRLRNWFFEADGETGAVGGSISAGALSLPAAPDPGRIFEFAAIGQVSEETATVRPALYALLPAGASAQIVVGRFMLAAVEDEFSLIPPYVEGIQQPTKIVLAAAESQRRAGSVLTHVISDEPLIADWTFPIDDVDVAIDDLTLPDVTDTIT